MAEYQLTAHNARQVIDALMQELSESKALLVTTKGGSIGNWGMARLWREWMDTTARFMSSNGVTMPLMLARDGTIYKSRPFNAQDAHELFTHQHLGCDADGTRLSWSKAGHDGMRPANKGERFDALRRHEAWATERGILLLCPRDSEYRKLQKEQEQ